MSDSSLEGAVCIPNIQGWGRRRRTRVGIVMLLVTAVLVGALLATHAAWFLRPLTFLPLTIGALALLQVRRNT